MNLCLSSSPIKKLGTHPGQYGSMAECQPTRKGLHLFLLSLNFSPPTSLIPTLIRLYQSNKNALVMVINNVHLAKFNVYFSNFIFWPVSIILHDEPLPPLWNFLYLASGTLYSPGFLPISSAKSFILLCWIPCIFFVFSTLECLRDLLWTTF